jgi:hypothetical protein
VYAYSQGIGSAREIARLMAYHPGFQWLTGMREINHHTLSDFRVKHKCAWKPGFWARMKRSGIGKLKTHCLTPTCGKTSSTRWAADSAMRRPPQEEQNPRFLQEKASNFSF